jgi:hypothetical protein
MEKTLLFALFAGNLGNIKENWDNAPHDEKLKWLKTRSDLYPQKGDIFNMADVYARTAYYLLPNNVHQAILMALDY